VGVGGLVAKEVERSLLCGVRVMDENSSFSPLDSNLVEPFQSPLVLALGVISVLVERKPRARTPFDRWRQ
jgi:hypothetical protein